MNRAAYTEIWFINNFMLSPARDGSVTAFCKPMLGQQWQSEFAGQNGQKFVFIEILAKWQFAYIFCAILFVF